MKKLFFDDQGLWLKLAPSLIQYGGQKTTSQNLPPTFLWSLYGIFAVFEAFQIHSNMLYTQPTPSPRVNLNKGKNFKIFLGVLHPSDATLNCIFNKPNLFSNTSFSSKSSQFNLGLNIYIKPKKKFSVWSFTENKRNWGKLSDFNFNSIYRIHIVLVIRIYFEKNLPSSTSGKNLRQMKVILTSTQFAKYVQHQVLYQLQWLRYKYLSSLVFYTIKLKTEVTD